MKFFVITFAVIFMGTSFAASPPEEGTQGVSLPPSLVRIIQDKLHFSKVLGINQLAYRLEYPDFEYLGASLELPSGGFESITHRMLVFRKPLEDKDWKNAEVFLTNSGNLFFIFGKQLSGFEAELSPYPLRAEHGAATNP